MSEMEIITKRPVKSFQLPKTIVRYKVKLIIACVLS